LPDKISPTFNNHNYLTLSGDSRIGFWSPAVYAISTWLIIECKVLVSMS